MTREIRRYTVRYPVDLTLGVWTGGASGGHFHTLHHIESTDPAEAKLLDDGGEFACWDAAVEFVAGGLEIAGALGPDSESSNPAVVIHVPQNLIRSLKIEEM